jgi:hypothetical protein
MKEGEKQNLKPEKMIIFNIFTSPHPLTPSPEEGKGTGYPLLASPF